MNIVSYLINSMAEIKEIFLIFFKSSPCRSSLGGRTRTGSGGGGSSSSSSSSGCGSGSGSFSTARLIQY